MEYIDNLLELIMLADKVIELVDVPVPISEEANRKRWFESGLAISNYRTARSKLPKVKND